MKGMIRRLVVGVFWRLSKCINKLTRTEVLVLGDSHAGVFHNKQFTKNFPDYFFEVISVGGATVSGLENPNSKTQALSKFREGAKNSRALTTIVMIGEVDTGFVIWYRAEKQEVSVDSMFEKALKNYGELIIEIKKKSRVICVSAPLPTIQDENDWGEVANARKEVRATQLERTNLTLKFNARMQEFCNDKGVSYISLDSQSLGEDGLVSNKLLNSNLNDHHYDMDKYAELIISELSLTK